MTASLFYVGEIFTALKPLILIILGLEIGFYIVEAIIGVIYSKITGKPPEKERRVKGYVGGIEVGERPLPYYED